MKVNYCRQIDTPLYIEDTKGNSLVDIENNHMEMYLKDGSILIIPSIDCYYSFIGDAKYTFGNKEVALDKLIEGTSQKYANYELKDGRTVSYVFEIEYDSESLYLLIFE